MFILDSQDKEKQAAIRLFAAVRAVSRFDAVGIKPYCYRITVPVERIDAVNAAINAMPDADLWNDVIVVSEETEAQLALQRRRNESIETGALQRFRSYQKSVGADDEAFRD